MERILKIIIDLLNGPSYELGTRFTQSDNETHYLLIEFKDKELDFTNKSLKINFIRADQEVVFTALPKLSASNKVLVPTNALEVPGDLFIEIVFIDTDKFLTVNKKVRVVVVETEAGKGTDLIPGDTFVNDINELVAKLIDLMNNEGDRQINRVIAKAEEEKLNISKQSQTLQNELLQTKTEVVEEIMEKESSVIATGTETIQTIENKGEEIKTELEILLNSADSANLLTLIGNAYRGNFDSNQKYYPGDIYYKKDSTISSFEIPNSSSTTLVKSSEVVDLKKFYKLSDDKEVLFSINGNSDNRIAGFVLENSSDLIRTNSTISFELPIIDYTVAINIPNTNNTELVKEMTSSLDIPNPSLTKQQVDNPLNYNNTQKSVELRKINY